jgi:hypothetical protein
VLFAGEMHGRIDQLAGAVLTRVGDRLHVARLVHDHPPTECRTHRRITLEAPLQRVVEAVEHEVVAVEKVDVVAT